MWRFLVAFALLWPSAAFAWSVGDVLWLKSGGPAMTAINVAGNGDTTVQWFTGNSMTSTVFNENVLTNIDPSVVLNHNRDKAVAALNLSDPIVPLDTKAVDADVQALVTDDVSPKQAHVTTLATDWATLKAKLP